MREMMHQTSNYYFVWQLPTELFGKLSTVVKSKSAEMKEKLSNYIRNEQTSER
jgi:hypothetical protein